MASFKKYKTKSGEKWLFKVRTIHDPITGKKKQTTRRGFDTKPEAERAARELLNDLDLGKTVYDNPITFNEFAMKWLDIYEKERSVKPGTRRIRQHEINNLNTHFENIRMIDITWNVYQEALHKLQDKYAYQTVHGIHTTGKMIFKKAMQLEVIKKNPTEYAYLTRKKKTVEELETTAYLPKYMEKGKLAYFLLTANSEGLDLDFEVFLTLAYTGLRVGEMCALKETDLINENGHYFLKITKTYYNPKNNIIDYQIFTPKTESSVRTIDIDNRVVKAIKEVIELNHQIKNEVGEEYHDENFIFVNRNENYGYPIYPKLIDSRMKRILKKTKELNQELSPHTLRHTHTSLLAEAGVPLERIMERLGHSDDKTTTNIYLHTTEEVRKRDSEKFGSLMNNLLDFL
ncbi:tyrosine-type recombinase/integrase [Oceanobacillus sp. FSL W7-1293]|uniref:site-specific integrase n=1 Tax=Oceanobacillus sp. FSL W7-1293 TaxID=2921699 RepID=UPI0030D5286F